MRMARQFERSVVEVMNFFGPPLVKVIAGSDVVDSLNSYADQVLAKEEAQKKLDYSDYLNRAVYGGFHLKNGFLPHVEEFLVRIGKDFFRKFAPNESAENLEISVNSMWIVSQPKNVWSNLHYHNSDISGVLYLKMPEVRREGFPKQYENILNPAGISFAQGAPGRFHKAVMTLDPKVADVFLFPSSLLHTVYPFSGPEERRSFSFNLKVVSPKLG